jgi:dipeptidyl-peptidase-4
MKKIASLLQFIIVIYAFFVTISNTQAQQKRQLTIEDIWAKRSLFANGVQGFNWMKDGKFYTSFTEKGIAQFDVTTGKEVKLLLQTSSLQPQINIDDYSFSADETKLLLATETESIYRWSTLVENYVYDLKNKQLTQLSKSGKQKYATFSPQANSVAFVRDNNLFWVDLNTMQETQITTTGEINKIINGGSDWVYEEEFELVRAFEWSPDGKKIAFLTFNETDVPEYNMQIWSGLYPKDYKFKYPKAGEKNATVGLSYYDLATKNITEINVEKEKDQYIPRIGWTPDGQLWYIRMNRLQNHLQLFFVNDNSPKLIYEEKTDTYLEIENNTISFLKNGNFVVSSEKTGFKHLYLHDKNGKELNAITAGNWEVDKIIGIDEKNSLLYYTSTATSPLERQLYVIGLNGKNNKQLTQGAGTHSIDMSADCKYFVDSYSNINTPAVVTLRDSKGKSLKVLEDNAALLTTMSSYNLSKAEFFTFKTSENIELHGYMIKPADFDANKKYPVLMHVYGGPGSQTADNTWAGPNYFWHQLLAQEGYIVVVVDNRGTGGKGAAFQKCTYGQLGKLETIDQIEAAKYLGKQTYVDANRIGIWGWSYGGYMSSLCILLGNEYFKAAIAVAPVTTWRFYDTIYTERYLKTPQENAKGYDDNSPISHAGKLKGNYLLIHGTGDDNVHFQNAVEMQNALIKANKQFTSFYYPNRNHGIYGGNTRLHLYTQMTQFIKEKL